MATGARALRYGQAKLPQEPRPVPRLRADGPNQVGSWDISYLPSKIKGIWLYLYLVVDVWSRKIVAWDVEEKEDPEIAAKLVTRACLKERISRRQQPLILHVDEQAPQQHPRRWTSATRCWHQPEVVRVNQPPDDPVIESATLALAA